MIDALEYIDAQGRSPYGDWFDRLPAPAAAKVTIAVIRMRQGNNSGVSGVGEGVLERTIDWGPGYRIYFARDGANLIILLGGSSKKDQQRQIKHAKNCWSDYKKRKKRKA